MNSLAVKPDALTTNIVIDVMFAQKSMNYSHTKGIFCQKADVNDNTFIG